MAVLWKRPARPGDVDMQQRFTHTVPYPIDQVISAYRQTAFFLATLKHAGAVTIDILEEKTLPGGGRFWKAKITESSRVPEFLRASDVDIYINESTFQPLSWKIFPNIQADRIALSGTIRLAESDHGTELVYEVALEVGIPLVGTRLELYGLKKIGAECGKQAAFLERWLTDQAAFPRSPS